MSHPMEAYFDEKKSGAVTDEQAKASMSGLVNDPGLLQDVCAMFIDAINSGDRCYAIGKVYDVEDRHYGCLTVMSEDVMNVIGEEKGQQTQEEINYLLLCAFLEYRRFCREADHDFEAWDDYIDFVMQKSLVTLFTNGVRARLIHNDSVGRATMPTVAFIVYQDYGAL